MIIENFISKIKCQRLFLLCQYIRILILLLSMGMLFYLWHRFGILRDTKGGYLLIDYQFSKGRSLCIGDSVLYQAIKSTKYKTGIIVLTPEKSRNTSDIYWISPKEGMLEAAQKIKARVLMVLFRENPENLSEK